MEKETIFEGSVYQIEYQPNLSNNFYTKRKVYFIRTTEENYHKVRRDIASIMEQRFGYSKGYLWNSATYNRINKEKPSMDNALRPYYKFTYNEELDRFEFTLVIPYDD